MKFLRSSLVRLKNPSQYPLGSKKWLQSSERDLGGLSLDVERNKLSKYDSHDKSYLERSGMTGGDRMFYHGYAKYYEKYLKPYVEKNNNQYKIIEIGILKGTGLGIWSRLFPNSRLIGLDIDVTHTKNNLDYLKTKGAFSVREPELYDFDQFIDNRDLLSRILGPDRIDIVIDDGEHSSKAILMTIKSIKPFLAEKFVYVIEDNRSVYKDIELLFPDQKVISRDQLTIISFQ